ncbi:FecR domain-containing protein [Parapedobacter sp. DT-150]|uniref:FecR domain-containing protein n=1 Tax=Parapedobacter sp. DT-150 TaxID=3396162 RepID=UPI003F195128
MSHDPDRIAELFILFAHGKLTEPERIELEGYTKNSPELQALLDDLKIDPLLLQEWAVFSHLKTPNANQRLQREHGGAGNPLGKLRFMNHRMLGLAAGFALVLVILTPIWTRYMGNATAEKLSRKERYKNDVPSGSERAVITFENGRSISLDSTGAVGGQMPLNLAIQTTKGGVRYLPGGKGGRTPGYHTVSTPQGGKYDVVLPDGSSAKLNAASSIHFSPIFDKAKRVVAISGEVYFDVVPDHARPFIVRLPNGAEIEVLGTSFNVKAYQDETIKTTLNKGSVKLNVGGDALLMKSGEQVELATQASNPVLLKRKVDLSVETSWKDGYFNFENAELKTIMNEVARWYDVDVEYKTQITEQFSILMLPRSFSISRLLELLELTGHVKFIIDGRRITVMT